MTQRNTVEGGRDRSAFLAMRREGGHGWSWDWEKEGL